MVVAIATWFGTDAGGTDAGVASFYFTSYVASIAAYIVAVVTLGWRTEDETIATDFFAETLSVD